MKVYVSVDMEGVAGIATVDQVMRGGYGYSRAQELMTDEASAAVAGAFDGGASEVVISDSHGSMDNLLHERLDPRARLIFGQPRGFCMAEGLTDDFDIALFVGYHAPAGSAGVLAHTFSSLFTGVRLNGQTASETSINALFAATRAVPLGLVTGDDVICRAAELLCPDVTAVPVKIAHGYSAANSLSPSAARAAIRDGARRAVRAADRTKPLAVPDHLRLEIELPNVTAAELISDVPGTARISDRTIGRDLASADELLGMIAVSYNLARTAELARHPVGGR